jgi:hypothetical protein
MFPCRRLVGKFGPCPIENSAIQSDEMEMIDGHGYHLPCPSYENMWATESSKSSWIHVFHSPRDAGSHLRQSRRRPMRRKCNYINSSRSTCGVAPLPRRGAGGLTRTAKWCPDERSPSKYRTASRSNPLIGPTRVFACSSRFTHQGNHRCRVGLGIVSVGSAKAASAISKTSFLVR